MTKPNDKAKPDEKKKAAAKRMMPGKSKMSFEEAHAFVMKRHAGAFERLAKR